jgi:hypothetical protein
MGALPPEGIPCGGNMVHAADPGSEGEMLLSAFMEIARGLLGVALCLCNFPKIRKSPDNALVILERTVQVVPLGRADVNYTAS